MRQNTYIIIGDNAMAKYLYHNILSEQSQDIVGSVAINGFGRMGRAVWEALGRKAMVIEARSELNEVKVEYVHNVQLLSKRPTVIIDFSSPSALDGLLEYAIDNRVPLVIATTGHSPEQCASIERAAKVIPIYRSANTAATMPTFLSCCRALAKRFQHARISIEEVHRADKIDAPSGTAIMIAEALCKSSGKSGWKKSTAEDEAYIGIGSERVGDVIGVHKVVFDCGAEKIILVHEVSDRRVFAEGAVMAARYVVDKPAGLYGIEDMSDDKVC